MSSNLGQLPQPSSNHHHRSSPVQPVGRCSSGSAGGWGEGEGWGRSGCGNKPITQTHWLVPTSADHLQGSGPSISSPRLRPPLHIFSFSNKRHHCCFVFWFFCPWKNSKSCKSADGLSRLCVARLCECWNLVCRWKAPEGCLLVNKRLFTEFFGLCLKILFLS